MPAPVVVAYSRGKTECSSLLCKGNRIYVAPAVRKCQQQCASQEQLSTSSCCTQVAARMKQYEDELARKRALHEHELQRQVGCYMLR
jgi:hypothetical protein